MILEWIISYMYILETATSKSAKIIHGLVFPDTDSLKQSCIQNEFGVLNIYLYPSLSVMVCHVTSNICTFATIELLC